MGDADKLAKSIKKTQELLGKHVKKPPLSEKNLARPPFRFLHDIVTNVISSTGYLNGVFSLEEMDSGNIATREAKAEFMQKLVQAIKETTAEDISVKISKILAGQEAEKTNELLQSLARAIEKNGGENVPKGTDEIKTKIVKDQKVIPGKDRKPLVKAAGTKVDIQSKSQGIPAKSTTQAAANKQKLTDKPKTKTQEIKPSKIESKDSSKARPATKQTAKDPTLFSKAEQEAKEIETFQSDLGSSVVESLQEDREKSRKSAVASSSRSSSLRRQNSFLGKTTGLEETGSQSFYENRDSYATDNRAKQTESQESGIEVELDEQHVSLYHDFKNSSMKPNMDTLPLPISPLVPDLAPPGLSQPESLEVIDDDIVANFNFNQSLTVSATEKKDPLGQYSGNENIEYPETFGSKFSEDVRSFSSKQSRVRPGTGTTRQSSARPPSARPAPPRPKSSMVKETEESNYRPPTGKVSNVLMENQDLDDEDDTFVVRETLVSKGPAGLSDLDEAPELALTSGMMKPGDPMDDFLVPPEQRGLLVNQILETQKELEEKGNDKRNEQDKQENSLDRSKIREITTAEIEKLKNLIQVSARNANPLGKLLDYVREDVDSMQKEITKWREESRKLNTDLESAKQATEANLLPLRLQLQEVETQIQDKDDAIAGTKMTILRHQDRIEKILSGLDKIKPINKKPMPDLNKIVDQEKLQPQPSTSSMFLVKDQGELEPIMSRTSSGFGSTLNRLPKGGMKPIFDNSTSDSDEDLDPDKFDPWKA